MGEEGRWRKKIDYILRLEDAWRMEDRVLANEQDI